MSMNSGESQSYNCGAALTDVTLQKIILLTREQKTDPIVRNVAENILRNVPEKNWQAEIEAVMSFVKGAIRYTRDIEGVEFIKTPVRHLKELQDTGISYGDCDDMSLLLGTLLNSIGYKVRYVIIRTKNNPLPTYNHIYVEVLEPSSRRWQALDATMKSRSWNWTPEYLSRKEYNV